MRTTDYRTPTGHLTRAHLVTFEVGVVAAFLVFFATELRAQSEIIDRVVAVVSGEVITQSDVDGAIALESGSSASQPNQRQEALNRLIQRTLMLNEVRRYSPPEPEPAAVEQRLMTIRLRFSTPDGLATTLSTFGIDESRLRELVRDDLRIEAYLEERFASPEPERREAMIAEWVAGLRRRADVVISPGT